MGCGEFVVKYVLFFVNLFFALAGLSLLGVGLAFHLQLTEVTTWVEELGDSGLALAPITGIVVGALVFVVSFFGCVGAWRQKHCLLVTYAVLVLLLMIVKITLASLIFVRQPDIIEQIPSWLDNKFTQDTIPIFHEIEGFFHCCGTTGPSVYLQADLMVNAHCCDKSVAPCTLANSYLGCNTVVVQAARTYGLTIGFLVIAVAAVELVAVIFALCLANNIKNTKRRAEF